MILDAGPETTTRIAEAFGAARTLVWNGPLGAFEVPPFNAATDAAREILAKAEKAGCEVVLPIDAIVAQKFEAHAPSHIVSVDHVGENDMILDVGPKSIAHIESLLANCKTLVWNGPFGAFELPPFDEGTNAVAQTAARLTVEGKLLSIAGGGDTVAALNQAHVAQEFSYVSTAGGAFLEWLEGKTLPGVAALMQSSQR
jgi:phosphoglycerate kinase